MEANQQNIDQFFRDSLGRSKPDAAYADKFWQLMPAMIVPAPPVNTAAALKKGILKSGLLQIAAIAVVTVVTGFIIYTSLRQTQYKPDGIDRTIRKDTLPAVMRNNDPIVKDSMKTDSSRKPVFRRSPRVTKRTNDLPAKGRDDSDTTKSHKLMIKESQIEDTSQPSLKPPAADTSTEERVEQRMTKETPKDMGIFIRMSPARTDSATRTRAGKKISHQPKN